MTMLSDCQGANSSQGIFILANIARSAEPVRPFAEARDISRVPDHDVRAAGSFDPADSRGKRWASLNPDDQKVFNLWARGVLAFYSVIIIALLSAVLLGVHPGGGKPATTSVVERGSLDSSASGPGSVNK